jgi:hypothetical protein
MIAMERRELLKMIALLTGGTVIGADLFLSGCNTTTDKFFSENDIAFFDEVAETIIPKTDTPGAKDAETGKFMAAYAAGCYDETQQKILRNGIQQLNKAADKKYASTFIKLSAQQKEEVLTIIDKEAETYNTTRIISANGGQDHYFTLMKQLSLLGFFTSQPGATKVLRYIPVPGKYEGCIDYKKGETAWA